jgi:hypothetical protein
MRKGLYESRGNGHGCVAVARKLAVLLPQAVGLKPPRMRRNGRGRALYRLRGMSSWICKPCIAWGRWVMRRTAMVNQIRSLLLERALTLPKGRSQHVDALLPRILEDAELKSSDSFRVLLAQLQVELDQLTGRLGLSSRTYGVKGC